MELKGQIILDDETMDNLKDEIREEVIEDIRKSGNYSHEIERYMSDCNFESYMEMIEKTIDNMIEKTNEEDIHFDTGRRRWKQLLAMKSLLNIR